MPKGDFNKVSLQTPFTKNTSGWLLLKFQLINFWRSDISVKCSNKVFELNISVKCFACKST